MAPPQWSYQVENFDPPPDEELVCSICRAVFCEPVQSPCHHVFCRQCIMKWLQNNSSCPVCRKRITKYALQDVVPIVKNMIMKLTLHCHNYDNGCEDKLTLEACESHIKNCKFEMVQCKNKPCKQKLLRKDMVDHETKGCVHRYVKCKNCNLKVSTLSPNEHNCLEELKLALKQKSDLIKKKNLKIKDLQEENKKLKQAESNRRDAYSDSTSSIISFNTNSSTDFVINWSNDDSINSYEDDLSDFEEDRDIIELDEALNDSSIIVLNSTLASVPNTSNSIELPRASNSDTSLNRSNTSHETNNMFGITQSSLEDVLQIRRSNKRRHTPSQFYHSESENEDEVPNDIASTWWASGTDESNVQLNQGLDSSAALTQTSPAGLSSSSTCSSTAPNSKSTSNLRKRYRRNSAESEARGNATLSESYPILEDPVTRRNDTSSESFPNLDDAPAPQHLTSRGAFERTLAMLERYNLESDPEWFPNAADTELYGVSDSESSDSSFLVDSSLDDSEEEGVEPFTVPIPTDVLLLRDLSENSEDDPDWIP